MLTKGLGRGGSERLLAGLARHVDPARFRVEVAYLLPWKDAFVDEIRAAGVAVHCLHATRPTSLGWLRRLRALVQAREVSLVHTHMPLPAAAARLALGGWPGRPGWPGERPRFVHTEHNLWPRYRRPTRWANALTYRRNAAAIAVSDGVAASIRARVPVTTVRHGIDLASLAPGLRLDRRAAARARLGLPEGAQVVGTVGNFTAKKDQATLLRAFATVVAGHPGSRLVLVGDGPLDHALRQQARQLGLGDSVMFAGPRDDVPELLAGFDLFVLSSRFEGLPIALLEAMANGVAPVATAVGGIPEVITDRRDGRLVPPGDPAGLAAAISELLGADPAREELAAAARRRAADFDLAQAVRAVEAVYDRVLGRAS